MNRRQRVEEIRRIAARVESLCHRYCSRELDRLQAAARRQEKQHRAAGRRICGKRYPATVDDAVALFTCKCILEPLGAPTTWRSVSAIREDFVAGQAAREVLEGSCLNALNELQARWAQLGADYSVDIAGNR